jgi:hypothetical protein
MTEAFKCKDLTSYGHAIDKAADLIEARKLFIEMVEQFDFKAKKASFIHQAKTFQGNHRRFTQWAWNIILSSEGLAVC